MQRVRTITAWLLLPIGLVMAFGSVLVSGFQCIPGYSIDPRFNHYLLEHAYQWIAGNPLHVSLWSPPFFYPAPNVLGYSDVMAGLVWLYAPLRWYGADPSSAFAGWILLVSALNYILFYGALRRWLSVTSWSASVAAFVFAFGVPRMAQMAHPQLWSQAYILILLHGCWWLMRDEKQVWRGWSLVWIGVVLQFYTAFYPLWFAGFFLVLLIVAGFFSRTTRLVLWRAVGTPAFPVMTVVGLVAVWPLLRIYLSALEFSGPRPASEVTGLLPGLRSWWYVGSNHYLYGWIYRWWPSLVPSGAAYEKVLGFGPAAMITAWLGLVCGPKQAGRRMLLATTVLVMVLTIKLPSGWSPWFTVMEIVPGASAIRAVSRIGLTVMIPLCFGLAWQLDRIKTGWWRWLIMALIVVEQGFAVPANDSTPVEQRVASIARAIGTNSGPVYIAFRVEPGYQRGEEYEFHIDAMWAGLEAGVPVVNGYSGLIPAHWMVLYFNTIGSDADRIRLSERLSRWMSHHPETLPQPVVVEWP